MINNSAPDWLLAATQKLPIGADLWCSGLHARLVSDSELVPSRFRMEHWMVPVRESERNTLTTTTEPASPGHLAPDPDRPGDYLIVPGSVPQTSVWPVCWSNTTDQYHAMIQAGHVTSTFTIDHQRGQIQKNWSTDHSTDLVDNFADWVELHIPVNSQFLDYYSGRMMLSMFRYAVEHNNSRLYLSESGWTAPRSGAVLLDHETRALVAILSLTSGQVQYYYQD
jgi:hypothetical protein